jgi:hypothetical protein
MRQAACWLALAAAAVWCGCGGAARQEAVGLGRVLVDGRQDFTAANTTEKDLIAATQGWVATIVANGAGLGKQLEQNASAAADLAKSADLVSTQLGTLRKTVYEQTLRKEFTQGVRSTLITQITRRQRTLQDIRGALVDTASQLRELVQLRAYKGDSYPGAIDKLNQMLQAYKAPPDVVGEALASLKSEYGLKDADLVSRPAAK